jgi:hypothetical protein
MGTWSAKPFGNDTALDWLNLLKQSADEAVLLRTFETALDQSVVPDADAAAEAIAAAQVVLAAFSEPMGKLPSEARKWVVRMGYVPSKLSLSKATSAISRCLEDSELRDLWHESGTFSRWEKEVLAQLTELDEAKWRTPPVREPLQPRIPKALHKLIELVQPHEAGTVRRKLWDKLDALEDVNAPLEGTTRPLLCLLAKQGLVPEAALLIDKGAIIDKDCEFQIMAGPPLVIAASHGHAAMVELLLSRGAQLHRQIFVHPDTKITLTSADPRAVVFTYALGLFSATIVGANDVIEVLARHGADLAQTDLNGDTLLHKAVMSRRVRTIEYLIDRGLDPNRTVGMNESPLHEAVRNDYLEVARCLLERGADPNIVSGYVGTALDVAPEENSEMKDLLQQFGAKKVKDT